VNREAQLNRKVFVVLSRTHTKIWKDDFEPGSAPENMAEEHVNGDYKRMLDKYFSGRKRSKLDPIFAERVAKELNGFRRIYLAGGGKGKASAVDNLATYLKAHHKQIAEKIHAIEDVDASNMSDGELLAVARRMVERDLL
jgi:hypothetical protein